MYECIHTLLKLTKKEKTSIASIPHEQEGRKENGKSPGLYPYGVVRGEQISEPAINRGL